MFVSCVFVAGEDEEDVPLLRSRKLNKYSIDTAGRSLRSSVLSSFFSSMVLEVISTSLSDEVDAAGASCFSEAIVTTKANR
jgi:hypothetical protein